MNKKYRNIKKIYIQYVSAIRPSSVELNVYKLLKKSMEYDFWLEFLYIFLNHNHMDFTCFKKVVHFVTFCKKTHENRSGESRMTACQNQKLQKLIFLDAELH